MMADASDVAKVLFEWLFNKTYEEAVTLSGGPEYIDSVLTRLKYLSEQYRIGIEDARQLLGDEK